MEKIIATVSQFASAEEYTTLVEEVEDFKDHVHDMHESLETSLATFISDHCTFHKEEKEKYTEELTQIKHDVHRLKVALCWVVAGLICSGVSIISLCIHILS